VAYAGTTHTIVATLAAKPFRRRCERVAFEAHDSDTHVRAHRELVHLRGRPPMLGALSAIEPANDSRYARLLECVTASSSG
jgi:hypothetical protein